MLKQSHANKMNTTGQSHASEMKSRAEQARCSTRSNGAPQSLQQRQAKKNTRCHRSNQATAENSQLSSGFNAAAAPVPSWFRKKDEMTGASSKSPSFVSVELWYTCGQRRDKAASQAEDRPRQRGKQRDWHSFSSSKKSRSCAVATDRRQGEGQSLWATKRHVRQAHRGM